ncbi:MAG: addiction module toxin, HicA family [SAR202 cluster bacterium]|nr:addiction module toxin, HicA family [SAR202 cluster bacterium]
MVRLPRISGKEMVRALQRAGFRIDRVSGSHHFLVHESGRARYAIVPVHAGQMLSPKVIHAILESTQLTKEELIDLL